MNWKNTSSYSRNDKDRTPHTWSLEPISTLRIIVTRHVHFQPIDWVLQCEAVRLDNYLLRSKEIEDAKREAVAIVKDRVDHMVQAVRRATIL